MWVRKRIEIRPSEIFWSLVRCPLPGDDESLAERIETLWTPAQTFVCLSIRSGFDLLLQTVEWAAESEVIMSCLTIPDMPRIVRHHNYVPIGVDVDPLTLAPDVEGIEKAITPRTKAIVVAHLFGGQINMGPIADLARRYKLLLIEDCAQAYIGNHYQGHNGCDVSMFSFGPIKTNTALAGGVFRIRRPELLRRMKERHRNQPLQTPFAFGARLLKYSVVKAISTPLVSGAIVQALRLLGRNHDGLATGMARGFKGPGFFNRIRQKPSVPLLRILYRKLSEFDTTSITARAGAGKFLADQIGKRTYVIGCQAQSPTCWVFAIVVDDRQPLVEALWRSGFDATMSSSLRIVTPTENGSDKHLVGARYLLDNIVFLPIDIAMPHAELQRMVNVINETEMTVPRQTIPRIGVKIEGNEADIQSRF
jgi:dTDP-4-amino-4,6-dideoxygalactose transaminase